TSPVGPLPGAAGGAAPPGPPPAGPALSQMRPPRSEYFAALVSRLPTTCASRISSPSTPRGPRGRAPRRSWPPPPMTPRAPPPPPPQRPRRRATGPPLPPPVEARPGRLPRPRHHRGQLQRLLAEGDLAAHDARHVEQVVHQPHQVRHLPLHHRAGLRDV